MKCRRQIIRMIILATASACAEVEERFNNGPAGILDNIINKTLESLKPQLENLKAEIPFFETGNQEFGNFRGHFNEVTVEGLEKFRVETLRTSLLDVKNLTIVVENISATGRYKINGSLAFPLGKNDIYLFGEGPFRAKFYNSSVSLKVIVRAQDGMYVVKDLDIIIELEKINVYLTNLMDGTELGEVLNQLINDVGLTVINYYKEPILEPVKLQIKEFIEKILNHKEGAL